MMRTDDRTNPRPDDKANMEAAPREARPQAPAASPMVEDNKASEAAAAKRERPMTADERRKEEDKRHCEEEKVRREAANKKNAEFQRMAEKPNAEALKLWVVKPVDPQQPPFMYSNVNNNWIVAAESAEYARRLVRQESGGNEVWEDDEKTVADEYKPRSPMVVSRDFQG